MTENVERLKNISNSKEIRTNGDISSNRLEIFGGREVSGDP